MQLTVFAELADITKLTKRGIPAHQTTPIYKQPDTYGMEYSHWPAWASCQAVLPSAPAHLFISCTWEAEKNP